MENRIAIIIALLFAVGLAACQTQQDAAVGSYTSDWHSSGATSRLRGLFAPGEKSLCK